MFPARFKMRKLKKKKTRIERYSVEDRRERRLATEQNRATTRCGGFTPRDVVKLVTVLVGAGVSVVSAGVSLAGFIIESISD